MVWMKFQKISYNTRWYIYTNFLRLECVYPRGPLLHIVKCYDPITLIFESQYARYEWIYSEYVKSCKAILFSYKLYIFRFIFRFIDIEIINY